MASNILLGCTTPEIEAVQRTIELLGERILQTENTLTTLHVMIADAPNEVEKKHLHREKRDFAMILKSLQYLQEQNLQIRDGLDAALAVELGISPRELVRRRLGIHVVEGGAVQ